MIVAILMYLFLLGLILFFDHFLGRRKATFWGFRAFFIAFSIGSFASATLSFWLRLFDEQSPFFSTLSKYGWFGMGVLSWFSVIALFILLFQIFHTIHLKFKKKPHDYFPFLRSPKLFPICFIISLLISFISFYIAMNPQKRTIELYFENLPQELDGLKIAFFSDLHVSYWIDQNFTTRLAQEIQHSNPDLILFGGDAVDGTVKELQEDMDPITKLQAPLGLFFITGNHELYSGEESWIQYFKNNHFNVLLDENKKITYKNTHFYIAGIQDIGKKRYQNLSQEDLLKNIEKSLQNTDDSFTLFLTHQPEPWVIEKASSLKADLLLAGHTHGGQFFPWCILVSQIQKYLEGLYEYENMKIYISKGVGFWAIPQRLGAQNEWALITLRKKQ